MNKIKELILAMLITAPVAYVIHLMFENADELIEIAKYIGLGIIVIIFLVVIFGFIIPEIKSRKSEKQKIKDGTIELLRLQELVYKEQKKLSQIQNKNRMETNKHRDALEAAHILLGRKMENMNVQKHK